MQALSSFSLHEYLQQCERLEALDETSEVMYGRGRYVYVPGESLYSMYEVVSGAVKIGSYSEDGDEVIYDVLSEGDFFGNLKYLEPSHFFEFAKTLSKTSLRIYNLPFFKHLIVHDPQVSEWFNYYIVKRWSKIEKRLFYVNNKDTEARLRYLIKHLDVAVVDSTGRTFRLMDLLSQQDIGNLIGVSRQTVSKYLHSVKNGRVSYVG